MSRPHEPLGPDDGLDPSHPDQPSHPDRPSHSDHDDVADELSDLTPGGRDPVADFFAAERAEVPFLPADDLRWARIRAEHRSRRGSSWRRYAVAAAAVLVAGSGVGIAGSLRHDTAEPAARPTATRTVYVTASPTSARSTAPATSSATTSRSSATTTGPTGSQGGIPAVPTRVPADFTVLSLSTVADGRLFALGSAPSVACAGQPCALVVTSADGGASWSVRGLLPEVAATARMEPSGAQTAVGSGAGITDVRFADDSVGWAFGSTVLRTVDGGRTWAPYATAGSGPVLALETNGTDVVLATTEGCSSVSCSGPVQLSRAAVGATSAAAAGGPLTVGQSYLGLDLGWRQQTALLFVRDGSQTPPMFTLTGTTTTPVTPPDCGTVWPIAPSSVTQAADGSGLVLVCGALESPATFGAVYSGDGTTWTRQTTAGPRAHAGQLVSLAAVSSRSLVLATGATGISAATGALSVSSDGGRTWKTPAGLTPPTDGFAWVGSPGGQTFEALAAHPSRSFWRSTDGGQTWQTVVIG